MQEQPKQIAGILEATKASGFEMASEPEVGRLLRALAASKPGGNMLELGTGTGLGTAWILDGMDGGARLTSVDRDLSVQQIARDHLDDDSRCTFVHQEGREFLLGWEGDEFDLVFADAWSGKFFELDEALALVRPGGFYVVDDLQPRRGWTIEHAKMVAELLAELSQKREFVLTQQDSETGILIATKRPLPTVEAT